jgi:2-polyprenyl-3-methyl-5-hydroxy-6-metoxy-1,4-benzoquinol methylase
MKMAGGDTEYGVVIGNTYDKYHARNPVVRWIIRGFEQELDDMVRLAKPDTIHEIGCGEGYWTLKWHKAGRVSRGSDFSSKVIGIAQRNAREQGVTAELFQVRSIYDLTEKDAADLLICCEVLEHLENPRMALGVLRSVPCRHLIVSVPREPLWRALNLARGHYIHAWGNTPGHIQHWSTGAFVSLISEYFEVLAIRQPLPWTMLFCRKKEA